jgi:2-phosphosulfolactate phosphatase
MSAIPAWVQQSDARVRLDWGPSGAAAMATAADFVVVVDVLRFTTAVEAAVASGAQVFPCRWGDGSARELAARVGAVLADGTDPLGPSLSPVRLRSLAPGSRVVLPSPNGSTCAAVAAERGATVVAACLRNVAAVADWLNEQDGAVAVIPCGERWPDGSLRPSLEDHLGAASLVSLLQGRRSAEAELAAASFGAVERRVADLVRDCASGRELAARGRDDDLDHAVELGASTTVPILVDGAFTSMRSP